MRNLNRIVIIGAGAAGLTTAESLRRLGFGGKIMIVHAESTPPYDRPPLSKQVLAGTWPPKKVLLRSPAALEKLALDWSHGVQASRLDAAGYRVELSNGKLLEFDVKLQMYGIVSRGAELQIVEGALHEDRFAAAYYEEGERLVAVLGWNSPKQLLSYRQQLLATYTSSQETHAALEPQRVSGVL
jgi:NADPH-dependent 2,4-dienoyl-CoA reductase/sulfur reductase-like enzyme